MKILNILFATTIILFASISVVGQTSDNSSNQEDQFNRLYIGLNGAFNINMPSNSNLSSMSEWSTGSEFSIIPSLEISYMISKKLGLGTGLKLGNYKTSYTVNGYSAELEDQFIDIDGDSYFPIYENVNVTEINKMSSIDIPLFIRYQMGSGKLSYFANAGILLSFYSKMSYTLDGTLTRMGSYPQFNVVLDGYPEYNYGDLTYDTSNEKQLSAPSTGISGFVSLGLMYEVSKGIMVKTAISGVYGLNDINPKFEKTFDDFHSSTIIGKTTLNSFAIELGIVYKLMNK